MRRRRAGDVNVRHGLTSVLTLPAAMASLVLAAGVMMAPADVAAAATASGTTGTTVLLTDPTGNHHAYRHGAVPRRLHVRVSAATMDRQKASRHESSTLSAKSLRYGGGASAAPLLGAGVTTGQPKVYLVFMGSQWGTAGQNSAGQTSFTGDPNKMAPALQTFFAGLGTNGETWSNIFSQYCDGAATGAASCSPGDANIPYPTGQVLQGVWFDSSTTATSATAAGATGNQLALEAEAAATHFGNTTQASNRNAQYVIVSPTGTNPDGWADSRYGYCAYHDDTEDPFITGGGPVAGPVVAFTNLPYVPDAGASCGAASVNSPGTLDGATEAASHEYAETLTDQFPGYSPTPGWLTIKGAEIGDMCSYLAASASGAAFNLSLATGTVAVQGMWSNLANNGKGSCVDGEVPFTYSSTITSVAPGASTAGANVTISGTNLASASHVLFGGVAGTVVSATDSAVVATVPAAAVDGVVSVVTTLGTATSPKAFHVAPTVTSFSPTSGAKGSAVSVTISGSGLAAAKKVLIGGKKALVTSDTATTIVATVSTKASSGVVSVSTKYGTAVAAASYTVP